MDTQSGETSGLGIGSAPARLDNGRTVPDVRMGAARWRRGSPRSEEGASLVEFALIVPLLMALLFGILEFGMALNDYQSIRQGVRDGARQAVVLEFGTTAGTCTSDASWPDEVKKTVCLTKDRIDEGDGVRVSVTFDDTGGEDSVKVCAQQLVDPVTKLIPAIDNIVLKSSIQMRMEKAIPGTVTTGSPYAETPPNGSNWTWC